MNIIVKISLRWHAIKDIFSALAPLMLIVLKIFFRLSKPYLFLSGSADLKEETHEEICLNKRKPRRGDETDIWGNWDKAKTWREQFSEKSGEARKLRGVRKSWKEIWDLGIWRNPPRRQMGLWNLPTGRWDARGRGVTRLCTISPLVIIILSYRFISSSWGSSSSQSSLSWSSWSWSSSSSSWCRWDVPPGIDPDPAGAWTALRSSWPPGNYHFYFGVDLFVNLKIRFFWPPGNYHQLILFTSSVSTALCSLCSLSVCTVLQVLQVLLAHLRVDFRAFLFWVDLFVGLSPFYVFIGPR